MKLTSIIILIFTSLSARCNIVSDSVMIDGNYRSFHFLKPQKSGSSLVFILHGSNGNGMSMRSRTAKLEEIATLENITLVYPNGYKKYWNECRKNAKSEANRLAINDNSFFEKMIEYFKKNELINDQKVFAVGTSGGGHMAYKLAITMPERFRAVAALIANLPDTNNFDCTEKLIARPILIINGTLDKINPYNGGEVILGNENYGFVRSSDKSMQYWAHLAGYKKLPTKTILPDIDPNDGKTIEKYTLKKRKKPEITLLKVIGGKHDYPNDIDVHLEAWAFFKRQL